MRKPPALMMGIFRADQQSRLCMVFSFAAQLLLRTDAIAPAVLALCAVDEVIYAHP